MIVQDTQQFSLLRPPSSPDDSDEAAPASAFVQLLNMFLAPPPVANVAPPAPPDAAASDELSTLPAAAPAPASDAAKPIGIEAIHLDGNSLSLDDLPELPTRAPSAPTSADSGATTPALAVPTMETSENGLSPVLAPATGDGQSTDAVEAPPVTIARRLRRGDEPTGIQIAETGLAGTAQTTLTQTPMGVAPAVMFEAGSTSELTADMGQSAAPRSESAGLDGSAMARAQRVAMSTGFVSETATAMESQSPGLVNQTNDDATTKQQVELPIAASKAPAWQDVRDGFKAQPLRNEDHASMAPNDSSILNATVSQKLSGMRHLSVPQRPLESAAVAGPATPGKADATTIARDADHSPEGMAALLPGDGHNAAEDPWQGQRREGDGQANPAMVAGAAATQIVDSHRGETAAPAWRPMVERLAREIGEHFRLGEHQAVLQLDPPGLGKVKIDLRIENGQLQVRIAAEGHESQGLIENHLPELQQALRAGRIDVGELRVTQGEWNGGGAPAQDFSQSPQGRQETARGFASPGAGDEAIAENAPQAQRSADGRVSMWA